MRKNYKIILIIIGIILTIILIACLAIFVLGNKGKNKEDFSNSSIEEWEKELLYNFPIPQTETQIERIKSGDLDISQKKYLEGLRTFTKYLKEKYPSYDCKIKKITIEGLFGEKKKYLFSVRGFSKEYEAITRDDNSFSDNFYSELYSSEYSNRLKSKIENYSKNIIAINTDFYEYNGMETKEGLKIENIENSKLSRDISIYVNIDTNYRLEELKDRIKELGLYGSYTIYNSPLYQHGMTSQECANIWSNNRDTIKYIVFNSWD